MFDRAGDALQSGRPGWEVPGHCGERRCRVAPGRGRVREERAGARACELRGSGTNLDLSVTVIQVGELEDFAVAGRAVCTQTGRPSPSGGPPDPAGPPWTCSGVSYTAERQEQFLDACRTDSPVGFADFRDADHWVCYLDG